jgi:hypothetical protein
VPRIGNVSQPSPYRKTSATTRSSEDRSDQTPLPAIKHGSSREFVGESLGVKAPASAGASPVRPSQNQSKTLSKEGKTRRIVRPPAGRGRAGRISGRPHRAARTGPAAKLISCSGVTSVGWLRGDYPRRQWLPVRPPIPKTTLRTRIGAILKSHPGSTGSKTRDVTPGLCTRRAPRAMTPPGWWLAVSD